MRCTSIYIHQFSEEIKFRLIQGEYNIVHYQQIVWNAFQPPPSIKIRTMSQVCIPKGVYMYNITVITGIQDDKKRNEGKSEHSKEACRNLEIAFVVLSLSHQY